MTVAGYLERIGEEFGTERRALGVTQAEVAEYLGVSVGSISNWEAGKSAMTIITERRWRIFLKNKREAQQV